MLGIDLGLYLESLGGNIMHTHNQWVTPLIVIILTFGVLSIIASGVEQNKYNPSTKQFRLM